MADGGQLQGYGRPHLLKQAGGSSQPAAVILQIELFAACCQLPAE